MPTATATATLTALDLFAGTGWGVACQRLGLTEYGVDNAPSVLATREANGMTTVFHDVWDGLDGDADVPAHDVLIASPPCQTFSTAGSGKGRAALDDVIRLVHERAFTRPADLRAFAAEHGDDRTALVLAPLAYAWRFSPTYVVLEQVPTVQPVWDACAVELREWGYSVWTGVLHAEQYGVPQTRRRSILIARADGVEAAPPVPTHSRYYARTPGKLDPGVLPWVSMAEALGWGMTERPYLSIAVGTAAGGTDPAALGGSGARRTLMGELEAGRWAEQVLPGRTRPRVDGAAHDGTDVWHRRPATTVPAGSDVVAGPGWSDPVRGGVSRQDRPGSVRVTAAEASALQSYPAGFDWVGNKGQTFQQIGNAVPPLLAEAILASLLG